MISEIIPDLYIGTIHDAIHSKEKWGLIICVAEWDNFNDKERNDLMVQNRTILHAPFMDYSSSKEIADETHFYGYISNCRAKTSVLEYIACVIHEAFIMDKIPILVHCAAGVERSPLAVTYYLHKYVYNTIEEAFDFVKSKRPIVEDRLDWLKGE